MNSNEAYKTIWAKCLRVIKDNIMALDVTGRLVQVLELQSGTSARGEWKRQEFIIETEEQYPRKICMSLWSEKVSEIAGITPGETITVSINLESREFQGRWYTEARAWRVVRTVATQQQPSPGNTNNPAPTVSTPPPPIDEDFGNAAADDLPF